MAFNSIFAWLMKKRIHQIDLFRKYPDEVQSELFHNLLEQGKNTEYGKIHNFSNINDYEDYRKHIPLMDYESLKPYVERLMQGEQNLLWNQDTHWFAKSSGTTSDRSKYIPITHDSLYDCHFKGGKDLIALYYENLPNRKLYNGKHLIIGGSAEINEFGNESYSGDLSAILVTNLPWWAEIRRTPSKEIALMADWEGKLKLLAENTIHEDVYIIVGVPSWTLVLTKKILEITGKSNLHEVWPNLELFMHGGVSFEPYRKEFERLMPGKNMNFVETYNASEGFFGIQDQFNKNELLLMLDYGIFYEFIPMSEFKGKNSELALSLEEVEIGVNYAIIISTNGGLWRYILGDTIMFTNKQPYRIRVTGRTESFINVFGEELMVSNTDKAIAEASQKTDAHIKDYTVCPIFMNNLEQGGHEWIIEFSQKPNDFERFCKVLDETLRSINSDYDAKRFQNFVLNPPLVRTVEKGSFENWLKSKNKLGGQHKIPRLNNSREFAEQILQSQQANNTVS